MKRLTALLTVICLAPVVAGGILLKDLVGPSREPAPWLFGSASARWTITEFADLECPFCKIYTPELKRWVSQQADVNLQWHHLPLQFHGPAAIHQARLVECAGLLGGADAFWDTVDQVFQRTRGNGLGFRGHLDVTGIVTQDLEDCADKNFAVAQHIEMQIREAASKGINATPTLLVTDNTTGKSVKLEGPADGSTLLSTIDWLAAQSRRNP
ncbi:Protein-disulfide isomerase [Pseudomonas benzenivorans]|nr:thioredoxin domain-containing protein [Pseudomonas benzenivorans]SDG71568.1 Protein-disulfide isomerase [Pseudomonas benzenivorans]